MSAKSKRDDARTIAVRRLSSARLPLAVCGLIALGYGVVAGAFIVPALLYALVIGATVMAPRRSRAERIRERLDRFRAEKRSKRPSLAAVLDAFPEPVLEVTGEGTIARANLAARKAFGAELTDLPVMVRFRSRALRDLVSEVQEGGGPRTMEVPEAFGTADLYSVHADAIRPRGANGNAARRRVLLVFREQTQELREVRTRTDFVANASHELRTPLTSLIGFIETLMGPAKKDAAARERFLGIMQDQARRMARLVDDLLTLSRVERESARRPRELIDVVTTIRRAADVTRPQLEADGIDLIVDVGFPAAKVAGDGDALVQVLTNLIDNAARYGRAGERVELSAHLMGDGIEIAVRDWGEGIDAVHIPRLTERFYRADAERSRATGGTGLGLAIVKHILSRHGARLRIESRQGEGSRFSFTLRTEREETKAVQGDSMSQN